MSTIIISPLGDVSESSEEVIQLQVVATDEDFVGLFDVLELWRSTGGPDGPFEELTSETLETARLPRGAADPPMPAVTGGSVNIDTKIMVLLVDEKTEVPITFSGVDPITFASLAGQITTQGLTLVSSYVDDIGQVVVQTTAAGLTARLRIKPGDADLGTDAAERLGLPTTDPFNFAFGRIPRLPLIQGTETYLVTDPHSSRDYFYKTRFRNAVSGAVSDFSLPFGVGQSIGVSQNNVVCGRAELVNIDGVPIANQEVRLNVGFNGTIIEGKVVAGTDVKKLSDENGMVEFNLVRGQRVTVAIIGTDLTRDILVPTDPAVTVFNLLDPDIVTGPDNFQVQVPNIITAERRSL